MIDPRGNGQTTKTPEEAQLRIKEVGQKLSTPGIDFAELARQYSEDAQSAARGGDFQAFSEETAAQLKALSKYTYRDIDGVSKPLITEEEMVQLRSLIRKNPF